MEEEVERVSFETEYEYYQGSVIIGTKIKHGEGILVDKIKMTQFTGTFIRDKKYGDTC